MKHHIRSLALATIIAAPAFAAQQADWSLFGGKVETHSAPENDFVHPLTSPYYNEDSLVTNDLRGWAVYQRMPGTIQTVGGPAPQGGSAQVYALQARLALTERLQLVAYKDGFVCTKGSTLNQDGWNDIGAGLKYAWYQDQKEQLFAASGIGYQFRAGDDEVLQNDDILRLWSSVNKGFDALHLGFTVNALVPTNNRAATGLNQLGSSTVVSWHLHADYRVSESFSPVAEINGYHIVDDGRTPIADLNAGDVASLAGGSSEGLVTAALGAEYRCPLTGLRIRAAYEIPLTNNESVIRERVTVSVLYAF